VTDEHQDASPLSETMTNLAAFALRHALESIDASRGPLIPFMVTQTGEARHLQRFVADNLQDAVRAANEQAEQADKGEFLVVAWDGYVTSDGERHDAVFIRLGERGAAVSEVFVQRYTLGPPVDPVSEIEFAYTDLPLGESRA
jgi:hypothetical protein